MTADAIFVTKELLKELKQRASEANSTYALARQVYKLQQRQARASAQAIAGEAK